MKTVQIGAFEAKSHFSRLLRHVQQGVRYEILHRGRPVAHLSGSDRGLRAHQIDKLLQIGREARANENDITQEDIAHWRREGQR